MAVVHLIPNWFFGYSAILEFAFAAITLIVGIYAYKVYKISEQRQSKLFSFSFLLISLSYFIWAFVNLAIMLEVKESANTILEIKDVSLLNMIGVYSYIILFITGLIVLTYMTLQVKNLKLLALLWAVIIFSIFLNSNLLYMYNLLSTLLLIFIVIHYVINYVKHRQAKTLLVLVAFIFLLFASIHFIISINHSFFYVIGHILSFIAYILILLNLLLVIKKRK